MTTENRGSDYTPRYPWDMDQARVSLGLRVAILSYGPQGTTLASILAGLESLINLSQPERTLTLVALGVKKTWFALWTDGSGSSGLDAVYESWKSY